MKRLLIFYAMISWLCGYCHSRKPQALLAAPRRLLRRYRAAICKSRQPSDYVVIRFLAFFKKVMAKFKWKRNSKLTMVTHLSITTRSVCWWMLAFMAPAISARPAPDTLIFTHELHLKKYKIAKCEACHVNILKSARARDENYADQQACNKPGCHDIKNQDSCFVCHTNAKGKPPKKQKREIKFNHKAHIKKDIDCKVCHGYIDKMTYYDRTDMPQMSVCMNCHRKNQEGISCDWCHTDPWIVMSHGMGDQNGHGELYNRSPRTCEACHENNFCDKCHQGKIPEDVHPRNYRYVHQFDAIGSRDHCYTCHSPQQFCDGCHKQTWGNSIVNHQKAIQMTGSCSACHTGKR